MTRYEQALEAHQDAVQRRDTRGQHHTGLALQKALHAKLRRERWLEKWWLWRLWRRLQG